MKKKIICVVIAVLIIVGAFTLGYKVSGSSSIGIIGGADGPTAIIVGEKLDNSLYQKGLEVIALMDEMVKNEDYVDFYTVNTGIHEIIGALSDKDYQTPLKVYEMELSKESLLSTVMDMSGGAKPDGMSEELARVIEQKVTGAVATQIVAMGGAEKLAAATVCTANQLFINQAMQEDTIYIYLYESTAPVAVTFIKGDQGIVSATGLFLLNDEFREGSEQEVRDFFEKIGATMSIVIE